MQMSKVPIISGYEERSSPHPAKVPIEGAVLFKLECVGSFNMDWRILVFYPEPEARNKIY
jgi:hypothetical protein